MKNIVLIFVVCQSEKMFPAVKMFPAFLQLIVILYLSVRQAVATTARQSGALSLVENFTELKYFHDVATPALLCHTEPPRRIKSPLL